jgi:hypothetical protein
MACGAPNEYSILSFEGKKYTLDYVPAGRPRDYQMQIHLPEVTAAADLDKTILLVNVFNSSERSTVEMRLGEGAWTKLAMKSVEDPAFVATKARETAALELDPKAFRPGPKPMKSPHIWGSTLPPGLTAGTHLVEVRTTDMFGKTHSARRTFRVE